MISVLWLRLCTSLFGTLARFAFAISDYFGTNLRPRWMFFFLESIVSTLSTEIHREANRRGRDARVSVQESDRHTEREQRASEKCCSLHFLGLHALMRSAELLQQSS